MPLGLLLALLLSIAARAGAGAAANDSLVLHSYAPSQARPSAMSLLLDDLGDRARGLRNAVMARAEVPRPGAQLHTFATADAMKRLPGDLEQRLLVASTWPAEIATPGYLLRTGHELEGRGAVIMPLQEGFDLHFHHRNGSVDRADMDLVVEIANPNNAVVEIWLGGAVHASDERGGRWNPFGGYSGPSAATAEAVLTELPRHGWEELVLYLHPGSKVRVVTQRLSYGHEVDGWFSVHASEPVHVDVRALDLEGRYREDAAASGYREQGGCGASGVYLGSSWRTQGDILAIPRPGRGRAYALASSSGGGQAPRGMQVYRDACRAVTGSEGVRHSLELPLLNEASGARVVQLLIASPQTGRHSGADYAWVGPVMVNGWLQRVRLDRPGHAEVLGAWVLQPGELRTVRVDLLLPASATGPSALELRTLDLSY